MNKQKIIRLILFATVAFFIQMFPIYAQQGQGVKIVEHKKVVKKVPVKKVVKKMVLKERKEPQQVEILTDYGRMVLVLYNETPLHRDNFIKLVKEGFYDSLLFHRIIKGFMIQGGDPTSKNADSTAMLGGGDIGYRIPAEIMPSEVFHKKGALAAARDNNPQKESSGCQFYIVQGQKFTREQLSGMLNQKNLNRKQQIFYQIYQTDTLQAILSALKNSADKSAAKNYLAGLQPVIDAYYNKTGGDFSYSLKQVEAYESIGGAPHLDGDYTVFGELIEGFDVLDKIANTTTGANDRPTTNIRMRVRLIPPKP